MSSVTGSTPATDSSPAPRGTAVLIVRGWSDPVHRWGLNIPGGAISDSFRDLVREVFPQEEAGELLVPDLDLGTFSTADPNDLVAGLLRVVDERWNSQPFERLIIIGFSAGTLLVRNLYATACGARAEPDGTVDQSAARPWASRVERLVLVAGITRGWSISSATPALVRFVAPLALFFLNQWARWFCGRSPVLKRGPPPLIQQLKRGAPFVIESRLKLLQVERHVRQSAAGQLPHTVLLLGSKDEYVSPADAIDLGPREGYTSIEVPESNHIALLHVQHAQSTDDPDKQRRAEQRARLLLRALTESPAQLADLAMKHADIDDWLDEMDRPVLPPDRAPEEPVDHVVRLRIAGWSPFSASSSPGVSCVPTTRGGTSAGGWAPCSTWWQPRIGWSPACLVPSSASAGTVPVSAVPALTGFKRPPTTRTPRPLPQRCTTSALSLAVTVPGSASQYGRISPRLSSTVSCRNKRRMIWRGPEGVRRGSSAGRAGPSGHRLQSSPLSPAGRRCWWP